MSRRPLLIMLLLCALPGPLHGQFGLRGGMNLTKFVGDDAGDVEAAQGLNLGMTVPLMSFGPISLVPEVYYSQKGAKQTNPLGGMFTFDVDYIEVPVLAKLAIPLNARRSVRAYVAGGPAFAWQVDCSFSAATAGATDSASPCGETFSSFDTAMEKADRGIVFSGGLDFTLPGIGGVNLDARLVRGLARLRADADSDIRNQAFSLMLGYYLGR